MAVGQGLGVVMPPAIAALPADKRGYPVPFFVAWIDGTPDFRCADGEKVAQVVRGRLCWICGDRLRKLSTFITGPLGMHNRCTSEGPMHHECADYALTTCPYLLLPKAERREAKRPDGLVAPPGMVAQKPDRICVIVTRRWTWDRGLFRWPRAEGVSIKRWGAAA